MEINALNWFEPQANRNCANIDKAAHGKTDL